MRWWVALLLSCSALVAAGFATGPFSHSASHRAAGAACAQARAARPCRELIALPQRGSSGFCSSAGAGLQPRKFPHRPRLRR
jgi:hypothetical protein